MYISKLCVINFRSLRQVIVRLEKGKNIIVGKNNSGKSNIIRGIEILVGEKYPSYQNFSDNDFYTYESVDKSTGEINEIIADNLYLEVELAGRDFNDVVINSIRKKTAFSKVTSLKQLYYRNDEGDIVVNFDFFQNLDEMEDREEVEILDTFSGGRVKKTDWKSPTELLVFLKTSKVLKLFFCKSRGNDEKVGFGLICEDASNNFWISHFFSKKLRDSLITTTVISSLRSQKDDLRIVHYTWFGKLIEGLWEKNKLKVDPSTNKSYEVLIKEKSFDIKQLVDAVFSHETDDIRKLLAGAIAHKSISFKFLNDTKSDLYKNVEIFVNDGIDRPINEKGTGIQSAIIIALFSLYCEKFHNSSSLLIAEEPELFLHPQAKRVISSELDKFIKDSESTERQLIVSTHSIEFLKNVDPYNIIRIFKNDELNCSEKRQMDLTTSESLSTELKRFLWSNNTELFFADKVILVEGGEVFLIPSIIDKLGGKSQILDYENITITRTNGKGNFSSYIKMLDCFEIKYLILGDLDCFGEEVGKITDYLRLDAISDDLILIKSAFNEMPTDYSGIKDRIKAIPYNLDATLLKNVFEKFKNQKIDVNDNELIEIITYMESRYRKGDKREAIVKKIGVERFENIQHFLREHNIFIWSLGDLETYYTDLAHKVHGSKDTRALNLSYILKESETKIEDYLLNLDEINELQNKILEK